MKVYFLVLFIACLACKPDAVSEKGGNQEVEANPIVTMSDTFAMKQAVLGFLSWYKNNYSEANSFGLTYQDKQGNFHVSTVNCEKYLQFLKSSGYISDNYVQAWQKYFNDRAIYMDENLQSEGPPEGFEFDLVLITQEPELMLNEIDKLQFAVSENDGKKAILQVAGQFGYDFEMVKENGKWTIEYIATMNYD